ncbi:3-keto-disaccharide hydrolase [Planctomicrobium sp. SH664]|uniref:3-keto-disaccharide hydrolase n=1 Tax=Planctomicrobium sp. SH664 TaxID=3448125 RepID=UPI003F5B4CF6
MRFALPMLLALVPLIVHAEQPAPAGAPITPKEVIKLFNGKDLSGFYSWLSTTAYDDPKEIFKVTDGQLHITGEEIGYLATRDSFRDYRLIVEFKWGPRTWGRRKDRTRDNGLIVHCLGPDGSHSKTFMAGIEAQIIEGGVGDILVVGGKDEAGNKLDLSLTCATGKDRDGEKVWDKTAPLQTHTGGRINWYGRDPDWADVLGFRGPVDVDSPVGEWTTMEVVCDGGHITIFVNGKLVNEGFDSKPDEGRILIQSELAEIFFRKVELHPLNQADKKNVDQGK